MAQSTPGNTGNPSDTTGSTTPAAPSQEEAPAAGVNATGTGTTPPAGQIGALPFSSSYDPVESQNLASNTENLRGSQNDLRSAVVTMQGLSNQVLQAMINPVTGLTAQVFVGYP